jgi:transcriptional regulator with GAF, ATPase, and Fis domain
MVEKCASKGFPILLAGATGTGKELLADVYAAASPLLDPTKAFAKLNCTGFGDELLRAELFGVVKGAYTGAIRDRDGFVQGYDLICLDELGDAGPAFQAALLRVVETKQYTRVGSNEVEKCNTRFIASTNRRHGIRADLGHRFFSVEVPPLAKRPQDIGELVAAFGQEYGITSVTERFVAWAGEYPWPGNVRELRQYIQRASLTGTLDIPTTLAVDFFSTGIGRQAPAHIRVLQMHRHGLGSRPGLVPLDAFRERFHPQRPWSLLEDLERERLRDELPMSYYLRSIGEALSNIEKHLSLKEFRHTYLNRPPEKKALDPEQEEWKRKLLEAGSVTNLAKTEGVSRTTMSGRLRKLGIEPSDVRRWRVGRGDGH